MMAVSRDMYCIYGILERSFETFIRLKQINERKKFELDRLKTHKDDFREQFLQVPVFDLWF